MPTLISINIAIIWAFLCGQSIAYQLKQWHPPVLSVRKALSAQPAHGNTLQHTQHTRRKRYSGKYPKHFGERYKETGGDAETITKVTAKGGTAAGQHRPIMVNECLHFLGISNSADFELINLEIKEPMQYNSFNRDGQIRPFICVDCTLGYGGHTSAILPNIAPRGGILHAIDQDGIELAKTQARLQPLVNNLQQQHGHPVLYTIHENFGKLLAYTDAAGITGNVSAILCDLGYSSMQVDDPSRGFSYKHDGPLDMRMKTDSLSPSGIPTPHQAVVENSSGVTAYEYLCQVKSVSALTAVLRENSDVENAVAIALALLGKDGHDDSVPKTTLEFAARVRRALITKATSPNGNIRTHSSVASKSTIPTKAKEGGTDPTISASIDSIIAKCMQAIRIEVNAEFLMLERLLSQAPQVLAPQGRIVFLTFHSGEDRRVKKGLKQGVKDGVYSHWGRDVVVASKEERFSNPRSKCAKLRWAIKT